MYQFCEIPAGIEGKVCGSRPIGKCYICGRFICRIHSRRSAGKLFCLDCFKAYEKEGPPQESVKIENETSYLGSYYELHS